MAGTSAGIATGAIMGGLLCIGLFLTAIAATIILSLISIYTSNHGVAGSGEEYAINSLMLKAVYVNSTYTFNNGTIADSTTLSTLCSTVYKNTGQTNVAGCVMQSFYGYGPYNDSASARRRRREFGYTGLYAIGRARIFYSTSCGKPSDKLKYANSTTLSKCVKNRLAACNKLFNNTATNLTEWAPLPTSFTFSIVDSNFLAYQLISIVKLFGVRSSTAYSIAQTLGLSSATQSALQSGCQFIGQRSQTAIAAIIAAQSSATTTQPTSTNAG